MAVELLERPLRQVDTKVCDAPNCDNPNLPISIELDEPRLQGRPTKEIGNIFHVIRRGNERITRYRETLPRAHSEKEKLASILEIQAVKSMMSRTIMCRDDFNQKDKADLLKKAGILN